MPAAKRRGTLDGNGTPADPPVALTACAGRLQPAERGQGFPPWSTTMLHILLADTADQVVFTILFIAFAIIWGLTHRAEGGTGTVRRPRRRVTRQGSPGRRVQGYGQPCRPEVIARLRSTAVPRRLQEAA